MYEFTLKETNKGQEVKNLQKVLGMPESDQLGNFGPKTRTAVYAKQRSLGLERNAVLGRTELKQLGCGMLLGADISHYQTVTDWRTFTNSIDFCFVKITEGQTHLQNGLKERTDALTRRDVPWSGYHFARPDTDVDLEDAVKEADWFCKNLPFEQTTLKPVLDLEKGLVDNHQYNADWANAFADRVKQNLGVEPILYCAKWFYDGYLKKASSDSLDDLARLPIWLASYNPGCEPKHLVPGMWANWHIWQWTSSGTIPGIPGKCDLNWMPERFMAECRL